MKRTLVLVASSVLALVAGLAVPAAGQEADPAPTITVTPATGLVDGQVVTVTGAGWQPGPDRAIDVQLCPDDEQDCQRLLALFQADADGTFTKDVRVRTVIRGYDGTRSDCRLVACRLVVTQGDPLTRAESAVGFDPAAPVAPAPTLTVAPDTDLIGAQEIVIRGSGFFPDEDLLISQCDGSAPDPQGCLGGEVDVDADGAFTQTSHPVELVFHFRGSHDCRGPIPTCSVFVFDPVNRYVRASAALQLRPDGREAITAAPTTGLIDGDRVTITGTGLNEGHEVVAAQCASPGGLPRYPGPCRPFSDPIVVPASRAVQTTVAVESQWTWTDEHGAEHAVDCLSSPCEVILYGDGVTFSSNAYFDARGYWRSVPIAFAGASAPATPAAVTPAFTG